MRADTIAASRPVNVKNTGTPSINGVNRAAPGKPKPRTPMNGEKTIRLAVNPTIYNMKKTR